MGKQSNESTKELKELKDELSKSLIEIGNLKSQLNSNYSNEINNLQKLLIMKKNIYPFWPFKYHNISKAINSLASNMNSNFSSETLKTIKTLNDDIQKHMVLLYEIEKKLNSIDESN